MMKVCIFGQSAKELKYELSNIAAQSNWRAYDTAEVSAIREEIEEEEEEEK